MKNKLKYFMLFVIILALRLPLEAQTKQAAYKFKVNLNEVKDDKLYVELQFPDFYNGPSIYKKNKEISISIPTLIDLNEKKALYHLPKMIPGSYSIKNYGSFISDFKAFDAKGRLLKVNRIDKNTWEISKPKKIAKISYWVDDTWDTPEAGEDIFEPGGTGFNNDNVFVINPFGLFGFFEGMENYSYEVEIIKPESMYGATALKDADPDNNKDVFRTKNYQRLADSPIMYSKPDTAWLKAGDTDVLVALYSYNKSITAKEIADVIAPVLKAQEAYLGGSLPVDNYAYIIYLAKDEEMTEVKNGGIRMGALEHSQSSFYFLQESMEKEELKDLIKHAAAHEFFHIVTPLTIHSEEIANFDFINPKMSKHLWLYEGITEYSSYHALIKGGIATLDDFLDETKKKIMNMREIYNDSLSFTEMSEFVHTKYEDQFMNVYSKGALIAMCLDIQLRELSKGTYGTQNLMADLSKKYGKDKSFQDDELFDVITEMTYPEIGTFFKKHVEGSEPLPIDKLLDKVGLKFGDKKVMRVSLFQSLGYDQENEKFSFETIYGEAIELTKLGEALGFKPSDQIVSIQGEEVTMQNIFKFNKELKIGDTVNVVVMRKDEDGSRKEVTLSTTVFQEEITYKGVWDIFSYNKEKELTEERKAIKVKEELRNTWLGL